MHFDALYNMVYPSLVLIVGDYRATRPGPHQRIVIGGDSSAGQFVLIRIWSGDIGKSCRWPSVVRCLFIGVCQAYE